MSLSVTVHTHENGAFQIIPVKPGEDLFGFENCRHTLWGHPVMSRFGLVLLPSLSHKDICVDGEKLLVLEKEIHAVLSKIFQVVEATGYGEEFIATRCRNALLAIDKARELGGEVDIS